MSDPSRRARGLLYAALAYGAWGFLPLYWKALQAVPALEIMLQRVLWAFVFYWVVLLWQRKPTLLRGGAGRGRLLATSLLLFVNWFTYIYAVNTGRVVEASLGYFVTPLLNIGLGLLVLRERLSPLRAAALALAAAGVAVLAALAGGVPWISLVLALSFSAYGLLRKLSAQDSFQAAHFETVWMIPAAALLLRVDWPAQGIPLEGSLHLDYPATLWPLLVLAGPVTGLPLIWFNEAAVRLPLSILGFFQYLSPTLQFLIGVVLYREPMSAPRLAGFALIWAALALVVGEAAMKVRSRR